MMRVPHPATGPGTARGYSPSGEMISSFGK